MCFDLSLFCGKALFLAPALQFIRGFLYNKPMHNGNIPHFDSLAKALTSLFGNDIRIGRSFHVPGGDINKSYGIQLSNGKILFMKANEKSNADFFTAEALCLWAISATKSIKTPTLLATGTDDGEESGYSFLLMEFVEFGELEAKVWENFALDLAAMHKADAKVFVPDADREEGRSFGFLQDNYIGKTRQINTPKSSWTDFFRDNRLLPQIKQAEKYLGKDLLGKADFLLSHLGEFLVEPEKPSLLHGDLWGGNVLCDTSSRAMLIDPACYVGHAEADIAMTELFGGFDGRFYQVYKEAGLLQPGYSERRDLYNLYHILNHLNMFGKSYLGAVKSIIEKYTD